MERFLVKNPFHGTGQTIPSMSFEEDTYSRIFTALKHPVRRKILAILEEEHLTYTELLNRLGVETGFLNYHLENLSELIAKDSEARYRLSEFGLAARSLTAGVEAPVKRRASSLNLFGHRFESRILVFGFVVFLILSNAFFVYTAHMQSVDNTNAIRSSLIQSRGFLIESVQELNRTAYYGDLNYGSLGIVYEDMVKLTSQCRFLAETDHVNGGSWARAADAFDYLSGFYQQLNQQYLISGGPAGPTSLNWLKVEMFRDVRGDLSNMLDLFPANSESSNANRVLPTATVDYTSKLIADTKYSKVVFGLGEIFKQTSDGSLGIHPAP